ncbi:polyketide synthase [Trichoderma arundinaceum]|uniref:Polyketide synthase n=1 Tax=Trichoderma arundinaceum TaxID=490622 RepID=A0A395NIX6_TRIAR|nr:polyketide synthase [Trichoderma arundinaceum]
MDDIAIIGVALRFPGDATSPQKLWDVLERKESQWSEFPKDRLNIDGYYHPSNQRLGSISFRGAHFLKDDISAFDAPFFSIPTEEANAVDPQQRMLLEISYEALENAGIRKEDIDGSDAAVYVGSFVKDYEYISLRDQNWGPQYAATGNGIAIMSNRISYFFNLHGPSMTVDTGCSSSLIAVHLAAQSLRTGETSLALAAGTGMILAPDTMLPMTALNFLSPDGKCFTFDSRANGYGRGEGVGVVVMKRLSDAIRDNDTIHAVMRASCINQDGRTKGITFPSKDAQISNIRAVYASAGLDFDQTGYIECHGTGTQAGDWQELQAISETIASVRSTDNPIIVGSVKTNVGHLEGAAGIAGLIKGVLALERGRIPPNINFIKGNPKIDFENWKVKVPTEMLDWPVPGIRRVSVNSFGFGGSNAHVVVDEAPGYLLEKGLRANHSSMDTIITGSGRALAEQKPEVRLFCFSANDNPGVARVMNSHVPFLESDQADTTDWLRNYSYTLGCRRSNLEWKAFILAESTTELVAKIREFDSNYVTRSLLKKQPKIGFIFCGQGAQWAQMGKDLMSFNVYCTSLKEASCFLQIALGSRFDLLEEILREAESTRISDPEISQPATTALQVALVDLLKSFGTQPNYVFGHSSGEIAAAYASGAISRYDAWKIAYYRGLAAASIPVRAPKLIGGMMVVGMSTEEVSAYLASINKSAQLACVNSPRSITISGQADAIEFIASDLRKRNIFNKVLNVKVAYHSSHMRLVEHDYADALNDIVANKCFEGVKMFSSVTGKQVIGNELNARYWADNMVSPVQYVAALQSLMSLPAEARPDMLIELSPGAALRSPTTDILAAISNVSNTIYHSVLERKQNGCVTLLNLIGTLWSKGYPVNMKNVVSKGYQQDSLRCLSNLPSYSWDHSKKYWHETDMSLENRLREYPRMDLIGARVVDSIAPFEPRWRGFLRISENPWIQDHQVQKTVVYPASGMVAMVLEGAKQLAKGTQDLLGYELVNMKIEKAMTIPDTAFGLEVSLNIKNDSTNTGDHSKIGVKSFAIYSRLQGRSWDRHASGSLRFHYKVGNWQAAFRSYESRYDAMSEICKETIIPRQLYEHLDSVGMNYGPLFQNIVDVRKSNDSCVSRVKIPDTKSKMPCKFEYPHLLHPATLDSMIQTLLAIQPLPMVPVFIKSLFVAANLGNAESGADFTGYSLASATGIRNAEATVVMKQTAISQSNVIIEGLRFAALHSPSPQEGGFLPSNRNLCSQIIWNEDGNFARPNSYSEQVAILAHKYSGLSILHVGGGYQLSQATLKAVAPDTDTTPRLLRYTIVEGEGDDTASRVLASVENTQLQPFIEKISDISGVKNDYHLIVVCNHAEVDIGKLKGKLKAGGVLLTQATTSEEPHKQETSEVSTAHCQENENAQKSIDNHVSKDDGAFVNYIEGESEIVLEVYRNNRPSPLNRPVIFLTPQEITTEVQGFIDAINRFKETNDLSFDASLMTVDKVLEDQTALTGKVIVSLLEFSGIQSHDNAIFDWKQNDFDCFYALQHRARNILWITRGAHMSCTNPRGSPILGLARTLVSEDPLKSVVTFDLAGESELDNPIVVKNMLSLLDTTFGSRLASVQDTEFAEDAGKIYIPRLTTIRSINRIIEGGNLSGQFSQKPFADSRGLELTISSPGISDDNLYFIKTELQDLGVDEVEIAFKEAPLSFLDLEVVLGRATESTIGADVRGQITRVGSEVRGLSPGDNVAALVADGSIKNSLRVKSQFVRRVDTEVVLSFLVSAYFALVHIGRARRGRKVLIHAGASAFGLVGVDLAVAIGAEVFATVAAPEVHLQREVLKRHGVSEDHILEADSGLFVTALLGATDGSGIDCVYNPTLEAFEEQFDCVRKCGSIIRFASKSMAPTSSRLPPTSVTVVNWDLHQLLTEDPEFVVDLLELATQFIKNGDYKPSLSAELKQVFDIGALKDGLLHLQQTPHVGYASLSLAETGTSTVPVLNEDTTKSLQESLESGGTYVLAGGLGGLGRSISELLVNNGARHLAFLSRSGASSDAAKSFIDSLRLRGVNAQAYVVDICNETSLNDFFKDVLTMEMPPIRGVFQCAAVLRDSVFENMTFNDWNEAIKPKTHGSWNLVHAISAAGHDPFYIFLASSSGVIGNRGQANYAAGNCFQDSFARYLQQQGKHAVAIDLGPVLGAGMLAENEDILDTLRSNGFFGIPHEDFLTVIKHAITGEMAPGLSTPAQITVAVGTGGINAQINAADPYWTRTALYSYLNLVDIAPPNLSVNGDATSKDMKPMLASAASIEEATSIIRAGLSVMLAKAMSMLPSEIDMNKSLNAYGVDSLVAVTIRNWILNNCGVQLSVFEILSESPIAEMTNAIVEKGGYGGGKME